MPQSVVENPVMALQLPVAMVLALLAGWICSCVTVRMASGGVLGVTALFLGVFFLIYALTPKSLKTLLKLVSVTGVGAAMMMEKARDYFWEAVDNWLWDGPQLSPSGWVLLLLSVTSFLIGSYVTKWKTEAPDVQAAVAWGFRLFCYTAVFLAVPDGDFALFIVLLLIAAASPVLGPLNQLAHLILIWPITGIIHLVAGIFHTAGFCAEPCTTDELQTMMSQAAPPSPATLYRTLSSNTPHKNLGGAKQRVHWQPEELTQQAIPISDRTADRRHSEHPPSRIVRPNSSSGSKSLVGRRKTPHPNPSSHSKPLESFDGQLVEKKMLFGRTQRQGASSPTDTVVERPAAAPVMQVSPPRQQFMRNAANNSPQSPIRQSPARLKGSKRKERELADSPAMQLDDWDDEDDEEVVIVKKSRATPKPTKLKAPAARSKKQPASQPRASPRAHASSAAAAAANASPASRSRKVTPSKKAPVVTPKDLSKMTVPALRNMLKQLGAENVFGSRNELVERIQELSQIRDGLFPI